MFARLALLRTIALVLWVAAAQAPARASSETPTAPVPLFSTPSVPGPAAPPGMGGPLSIGGPSLAPAVDPIPTGPPTVSPIVQPPQVVRPKPSNPDEYADLSPDQPRPIDVAQERLYQLYKNKRARSLKKAYDAITDHRYELARKLAAPFLRDPLFLDYGIWLTSQGFRGEARQMFQAHKLDQAKSLAQNAVVLALRLDAEDPYSPFIKTVARDIALAELVLADVEWARKKWQPATEIYEKAFQRLSTVGTFEELRPEILGHYAESCSKRKPDRGSLAMATSLCRPWIQKFNALFPRGSVETRAISKFFHNVDEMERSPRAQTKLTQAYKAPDLDQAAFDSALAVYFDGKYKDASQKLQQFNDGFPKSSYRFRARYWLAQALTLQQEHEQAQKEFDALCKESPLTWYGLLSALSSGREIDGSIDGVLPQVAETDAFLQPGEARRLRRAQYFVVEGAFELAAIELREIRVRDALSSPFLMYLAMLSNEAQAYNTSFVILSQLFQRGYEGAYSSYTLRLVFPSPFMDLIKKYSTEDGLDPLLVLSLIKQESAFNPGAGSGVGAVGLMQLMPQTAVEVNPDITRADLIAPDVNIQTGARYLKRMLTRYNGNVVLALAAYNAGPAAADRWLKETPQTRGMLEFIEAIPYRETREYVGSIIRNYYWYSKRLSGEIPKTLAYFWNIYGPPSSTTLPSTSSGS